MTGSDDGDPSPVWIRCPVVLVGMMGAGKTAVGQRLATRLGVPFHDADVEIERLMGSTISEMFARRGEAFFRAEEHRIILQLLHEFPAVLATGGGAFINTKTRAAIQHGGVSIWLRCRLDTLVKRTKKCTVRPLLQTSDPAEILGSLMVQRHRYYSEADITVDNDEEMIDLTAFNVLQALVECQPR